VDRVGQQRLGDFEPVSIPHDDPRFEQTSTITGVQQGHSPFTTGYTNNPSQPDEQAVQLGIPTFDHFFAGAC
jgi:hypothetical protein